MLSQFSQKNKQKFVIANWKMHPQSPEQVITLLTHLQQKMTATSVGLPNIVLAPSFVHLSTVQQFIQQHLPTVQLAAQNVCGLVATQGAFTGEVSAMQLADLQVQRVIIGHSERRQYFLEENQTISQKIAMALQAKLQVVLCVGETAAQYHQKLTEQTIIQQLSALKPLINNFDQNQSLIIAYEPVWAIGTGLIPTVDEVVQVHELIQQYLTILHPSLANTAIVYGGSVKAENASTFAQSEAISGVLVGGASLEADGFWQIINAFCEK